MPKCNVKDFYFKTSVEAEETCKRYRESHRIRIFMSFERQDQLLGAPQKPQEMEGTEE